MRFKELVSSLGKGLGYWLQCLHISHLCNNRFWTDSMQWYHSALIIISCCTFYSNVKFWPSPSQHQPRCCLTWLAHTPPTWISFVHACSSIEKTPACKIHNRGLFTCQKSINMSGTKLNVYIFEWHNYCWQGYSLSSEPIIKLNNFSFMSSLDLLFQEFIVHSMYLGFCSSNSKCKIKAGAQSDNGLRMLLIQLWDTIVRLITVYLAMYCWGSYL